VKIPAAIGLINAPRLDPFALVVVIVATPSHFGRASAKTVSANGRTLSLAVDESPRATKAAIDPENALVCAPHGPDCIRFGSIIFTWFNQSPRVCGAANAFRMQISRRGRLRCANFDRVAPRFPNKNFRNPNALISRQMRAILFRIEKTKISVSPGDGDIKKKPVQKRHHIGSSGRRRHDSQEAFSTAISGHNGRDLRGADLGAIRARRLCRRQT
jgi:hypothetical protein